MPKVEFDPSPICIAWAFKESTENLRGTAHIIHLTRPVVYCSEVRVWEGKWEKWYSGPDEEDLKAEWDFLFYQFQAEQFKEWLKTNGPREED